MVPITELVMGGGTRETTIARTTGRRVVLNGVASPPDKDRRDVCNPEVPVRMAAGYALTYNVPLDIWNNWLHYNEDSDVVVNKMVFASPKMVEVIAEARANEGRRSGLEPMGTQGDPRMPPRKPVQMAGGVVGSLETLDRTA
jgi:hypothetical protein